MSSNDYSKLLRSYNWTGEINSRLPTTYVVADGDGFYTLRYSFFQNYSDHEISPDYDESDPEFKILESGFVIQPLSQTQESLVNTFLSGPFTEFDVFFGNVANVKFEQGGLSDSHITVGNLDISYAGFQNNAHGGGYAYNWAPSSSYPEGRYGDIWFNQDMDTDQNGQPDWESGDATVGSKVYLTVLHELAHAMGLADISSTSLKGTYMDSHKYSIMTSTYAPGMEFTPGGLQLLDIAALQAIYGVNTETRKEDTVYDIYGGAFASAKQHGAFLYTIWDGGGIDTIDVSGFSSLGFGAEIDLREGRFSSIGLDSSGNRIIHDSEVGLFDADKDPGNVSIAYGTVIENATGTAHADRIIGNQADNKFIGGAGEDHLYGGAGRDTVDYSVDGETGGTGRIEINLDGEGNGTAIDGFGDTDHLYKVENFILSAQNDLVALWSPGRHYIDGRGTIGNPGV